MLLLKIMLLSFDDAKVRRFLQPSKKDYLLSSKKCLSFDVYQAVVCEHNRIVYENTFILHFLKKMYINKKIRMRFLTSLTCFLVGADGFEPPKSKDSRFTVCPIWPLWKTPLTFGLSLLSDSNQRPRDYKSRALANWAKEAIFTAVFRTREGQVVKRLQSYYLFLNYQNFSGIFLSVP